MQARAAAKTDGFKRYHGKPCRFIGHGSERYTTNGACVECCRLKYAKQASELQKNWRERNLAKARAIGRRSEQRRRDNAEFQSFIETLNPPGVEYEKFADDLMKKLNKAFGL